MEGPWKLKDPWKSENIEKKIILISPTITIHLLYLILYRLIPNPEAKSSVLGSWAKKLTLANILYEVYIVTV